MKNIFLRLLSHFTLIIIFFVFFSDKTYATVVFQDDFNDGNLDDWTETRSMQWENHALPCFNNGVKANWTVISGKAGISLYGPPCVTEIVPDNFQLNTDIGYVYEFDMEFPFTIEADRNYVVRYHNGDNWYGLHVFNNEVYFQKVIAGKGYGLAGQYTQYHFLPDHSYHFRNEIFNDGVIRIFVDGNLLFELQDEEPILEGGIIGLQASTGSVSSSHVFFDNVRVSTIDPPVETKELAVPYFNQKKPWGGEEYDRASQYSWADPPTIQRWGCALTSMVMVLHFHGITTLPDGQPLNPSTLNAWLNIQPDGYLPQANLNWNAVTRLTRLIAESNGLSTPKLEYRWKSRDDEALKAEINSNQPAIVKTENHFVTARGYVGDVFSINDPYWPMKQTLAEYNNQYDDMRLFTPTQSDLSYLLFVIPEGNSIVVKKAVDQQELGLDSYLEGGIADQGDPNAQQPTQQVTQLSQPEKGQYLIDVIGAAIPADQGKLYVYNKQGEVQIFPLSKSGLDPVHFLLDFQNEGVSSFEPLIEEEEEEHDFDTFLRLLNKYWQQKEIKKQGTYSSLKALTMVGMKAKKRPAKAVAAQVIELLLKLSSNKEITPNAKKALLTEIEFVQAKYSRK